MSTTTLICTMLSRRVARQCTVLEAAKSHLACSMAEATPDPLFPVTRRHLRYLRSGLPPPVGLVVGNGRASRHALSSRRHDLRCQADPQPLRHQPSRPRLRSQWRGNQPRVSLQSRKSLQPRANLHPRTSLQCRANQQLQASQQLQVRAIPVARLDPKML